MSEPTAAEMDAALLGLPNGRVGQEDEGEPVTLDAPFPWFGGKRRVADAEVQRDMFPDDASGRMHRPAFLYYGSKFLLARQYPVPRYDTIIEPFAGAAGYSLRYYKRRVCLIDAYDVICDVWRYLIETPPQTVLALPLIRPDQTVDELPGLSAPARHLIGFWVNKAVTSPCKRMSAWARSGDASANQYWSAGVRAHVARVASRIKHWTIHHCSYTAMHAYDGEATWFIDPPYWGAGRHYKHGSSSIDYTQLADFCRSRRGQTIVCEGPGADWLPFTPFTVGRSASRKSMSSKEVIWTGGAP